MGWDTAVGGGFEPPKKVRQSWKDLDFASFLSVRLKSSLNRSCVDFFIGRCNFSPLLDATRGGGGELSSGTQLPTLKFSTDAVGKN